MEDFCIGEDLDFNRIYENFINFDEERINHIINHMHQSCRSLVFQKNLINLLNTFKINNYSKMDLFISELCNKSLKYCMITQNFWILDLYSKTSTDKTNLYIAINELYGEDKTLSLQYARLYNDPSNRAWNHFLQYNQSNDVIDYWLHINPPPLYMLIKKNKIHLVISNILYYSKEISILRKKLISLLSYSDDDLIYISELSVDNIKSALNVISKLPSLIIHKPIEGTCLVSLDTILPDSYYFQCSKYEQHIIALESYGQYYFNYSDICPYCHNHMLNIIYCNSNTKSWPNIYKYLINIILMYIAYYFMFIY